MSNSPVNSHQFSTLSKSKILNTDWFLKLPSIWEETMSVPLLWTPLRVLSEARPSRTLVPQLESQSDQELLEELLMSLESQSMSVAQSTLTKHSQSIEMPHPSRIRVQELICLLPVS